MNSEDIMNYERLKFISDEHGYNILPVKTGMQVELHERVGEGSTERIWKFKGLIIKVRKPGSADGTFTIRGLAAGQIIEKVYPLSFPKFEKVLLLDEYKIRKAKLYYIREKVGKAARMKSKITADRRELNLLQK